MSRHLPTKHELSIATSPCYGLVHGFRGLACAALAHNAQIKSTCEALILFAVSGT